MAFGRADSPRYAGRTSRPLLAFRRHRLGLPFPAHLPRRPPLMRLAADSKVYLRTTAVLLVLLALTIAAAFVNLGPLNTIVAMAISLAKGALIVLFFMHVRG